MNVYNLEWYKVTLNFGTEKSIDATRKKELEELHTLIYGTNINMRKGKEFIIFSSDEVRNIFQKNSFSIMCDSFERFEKILNEAIKIFKLDLNTIDEYQKFEIQYRYELEEEEGFLEQSTIIAYVIGAKDYLLTEAEFFKVVDKKYGYFVRLVVTESGLKVICSCDFKNVSELTEKLDHIDSNIINSINDDIKELNEKDGK